MKSLRRIEERGPCLFVQMSILVLSSALYLANKLALSCLPIWEIEGSTRIFLSGYLDDILAPFAFFALVNSSFLISKVQLLDFTPLVLLACIASIVWEVAAPLFVEGSVADPVDFAAYLVGTIGYWLMTSPIRLRTL